MKRWYDDIDDINDLIQGKCLVSMLLYKNKLNIRTLPEIREPKRPRSYINLDTRSRMLAPEWRSMSSER
jgi:hypothetical protein